MSRARILATIAALGAVYFAEGFDIFLVGKIAPVIANSYAAPAEALAPVIIAHQVGLAVGAVIGGLASDRVGRVPTLIGALFLAALVTLMVPLAHTINELGILRGLAGAFLGGAAPVVLALTAHHAPEAWRSVALTVVLGSYSLGAAAGSLVALLMIEPMGWGSGFVLGAVMLFATIVPIAMLVRDILPVPRSSKLPRAGELPWGALLALGSCFFLSMGSIALLNAWLPSLFDARARVSVVEFAGVGVLAGPSGLTGMLIIGWLARHIPLRSLTLVVFGSHVLALAMIGQQSFGTPEFVLAFVLAAFFQAAGQGLLNIAISRRFPDKMRATTFGFVGAVGRVGGIAGPLIGAIALAGTVSLGPLMIAVAGTFVIAGGILWITLNHDESKWLYLDRANS